MEKKLLIVAPNLRISNGITSFIINNYPYIIEDGYIVDFLLIKKVESPYNRYVESNGSTIYVFPSSNKYSAKNYKYVIEICKNNNYKIIHCNLSGMYGLISLRGAEKAGIKHRIYHCHNPKEKGSLKGRIRSMLFDEACIGHCSERMACTVTAGKSVYGNRKFTIINNGIDFARFRFDRKKRAEIRNYLNINDNIVIGTVCRQANQKNPLFIIDITRALYDINDKYRLIWVGSGPMLQSVKDYAKEKGVANFVYFMGDRSDIGGFYSAFDAFLLPSIYEGLGIVFIEAQVNGLPCFASDNVPKETMITENIFFYSNEDLAELWARRIDEVIQKYKKDRNNIYYTLNGSDLNISESSKKLVNTYNKME